MTRREVTKSQELPQMLVRLIDSQEAHAHSEIRARGGCRNGRDRTVVECLVENIEEYFE